ncbi:MAG: hypothetical protein WCI67_21305 [Chloroflexales bacterium]
MRREASTGNTLITNHRRRRWLTWPTAIISVAVLTLAIFNPLLCILHCALAHQHPAVGAATQPAFLCQIAHDTQPAATPFDRVWDGPRAVYEVTPFSAVSFILIIVIMAIIMAPRARAPQHITKPSAPPPKIGLRSTLA